eukprot:scaffold75856_cov22-Prasinocladus_malaysianus.AAC.1
MPKLEDCQFIAIPRIPCHASIGSICSAAVVASLQPKGPWKGSLKLTLVQRKTLLTELRWRRRLGILETCYPENGEQMVPIKVVTPCMSPFLMKQCMGLRHATGEWPGSIHIDFTAMPQSMEIPQIKHRHNCGVNDRDKLWADGVSLR